MRTTRSTMLEVIRQDYIRCIRAKGQSEGKTIWGHALRNALIPIVTVVGIQCGVLLAARCSLRRCSPTPASAS